MKKQNSKKNDTTNTNTFAGRVKFCRQQNNLTRPALAAAVGVKTNAIYNWETGRSMPRPKTMKKLAETFVVFEKWLETGNGPKNKAEQEKLEDEARIKKCQREEELLAAKKTADVTEPSSKPSPRASYFKPAAEQTRDEKILWIVNRSIQSVGKGNTPEARKLHKLLSTIRTETEDFIFFGPAADNGERADSEAITEINQLIGSLGSLDIQTSQKEDLYLYLNEKRADHEMKLLFK